MIKLARIDPMKKAVKPIRILKTVLIFYQKLIFPGLVLSGLLGYIGLSLMGGSFIKKMGCSYIISGLLVHYFIYEIGNYNEYYFYYNMGLSRMTLWITTFVLSFIIGLIFILL